MTAASDTHSELICPVCNQNIQVKRGSVNVPKHVVPGGIYCQGSPYPFAGATQIVKSKKPAPVEIVHRKSGRIEADWEIKARKIASQGGITDAVVRNAEKKLSAALENWTVSAFEK